MKNYLKKIEKNIPLYYIYNFLMYFRVTNAIWLIYLSFKGITLVQIGLLESIFHITSFVCEIPTGALADIYGRKYSMILGRVCSVIGAFLMIVSNSFIGFAIAFVFDGLSYTLNSGAGESLLFDSIKQVGGENEYKKVSGSVNFILEIGQAIAIILGGYLSDIRFIYAYVLSLLIQLSALIIAAQFTEPEIREQHEQKENFIHQIQNSFTVLKENMVVFYLIIFISLVDAIGATVYFYCQKYFEGMNQSKSIVALIFMMDSILMAISAKFAYRIEGKLGKQGTIMLLPILDVICLVGVGLTKGITSVLFFFIVSFVDGFSYPVFSYYINTLIPSERRATILSMESLCFSVSMILVFPLVGYLGQKFGLAIAFTCLGILFIPGIILIMLKLRKLHN